jgi:hypothetical protein
MLYAALICCDEDCTEVFEAYGSLEELETLACDCGCALQIISISEADPGRSRDHGLELIPVG